MVSTLNVNKAKEALKQLITNYSTFVIDIETGAEKDNSFEHSNLQKLLCVGIGYSYGKVLVLSEESCQDKDVKQLLKQLLETKRIVGHNLKFDLAGLSSIGKGKAYFDTMLASYVMDERGSVHGLKYLAAEILGAPDYESEIKQYLKRGDIDYADIPRDILYKYNAYDIACTWALYEYYANEMKEDDWKLHNFLCEASNELMALEMSGIKLDLPYLEHLETTYEADLDKRSASLYTWVDNPRSPKQVKEALSQLGCTVDSTNEETLSKVLELAKDKSLVDFVTGMLEYRKQHKLYSTYVKGLKKRLHNGRVYPTFLLHGTTTGRLSCRNPNLQNIPRGSSIRSLFVPEEGNCFIQADYSQAELRTVAALAGDRYLQGVFNEGRDIHGEVAARFFGPGYTKEQRVRAKMVVFGLTYAMTPHGLARRMNIELEEAQRYQEEFFAVIPDVVKWRESVKNHLLTSNEDLVTPFGRRRRYGLITDDNKEDIIKEGTAFLPQSIASDICLNALVNINTKLKTYAPYAAMRLPVHDSIMVECPIEYADIIAELMKMEMEQAAEIFTTFVKYEVDVSISDKSWGDL